MVSGRALADGARMTPEFGVFASNVNGDWFSGATLTLDGGRDHHVGPWPIECSRDADGRPLQEARRG